MDICCQRKFERKFLSLAFAIAEKYATRAKRKGKNLNMVRHHVGLLAFSNTSEEYELLFPVIFLLSFS